LLTVRERRQSHGNRQNAAFACRESSASTPERIPDFDHASDLAQKTARRQG